jgi:APA family basic amino acid/polyamine antiporter
MDVTRLVRPGSSKRGSAAPPPPPAEDPGDGLGLGATTALIVGSIVGVGIFNLPTALASYGPISLVSMGLTTIGALALALLFATLSRRLPADGGPYAYAHAAFGDRTGFVSAWSYWITAWAGNAAIAVGWVLYVEVFVNTGHEKLWSIALVLTGLWVPAAINLSGVKNVGAVQVATSALKFVALAFMSTVGLFYIKSGNFSPFNASGGSALSAVGGGMAIALFSYLGVETAAVAAARVRDPDRNVPRATLLGTSATAVVYVLSLVAVLGIVPASELADTNAPYSAAVNAMFGGTLWGDVIAAVVIVSGLGALNGWTLITAEMPLAAARDGLFPERFKELNRHGVPAFGVIASTALASLAIIINYLGSSGVTVFTTLVLMTGITSAVPYLLSALAQIKWSLRDRRAVQRPRLVRDLVVAVLVVVFSGLFIWYSRDTGQDFWVYWAPFFLTAGAFALGVPVYRAQRHRLTTIGTGRPADAGPRAVVALGGNALLRRGERFEAAGQERAARTAAERLAGVARRHRLVVTHGNGPQIGLLAAMSDTYRDTALYPLDVLGAETEGQIGYLLDRELDDAIDHQDAVAVLTRVVVDERDPAFAAPSKFIGKVLSEADARAVAERDGVTVAPDGDGWRRVVPSPEPLRIVELAAIERLVEAGFLVICAGGGGVPVVVGPHGRHHGVEAVVDKDLASALLAEGLGAGTLVLATDVDAVYDGYGGATPRRIARATPAGLRALDFAAGSMGPKVAAACRFVERTGGRAAIGSLDHIDQLLDGEAGTQVTRDGPDVEYDTRGPLA